MTPLKNRSGTLSAGRDVRLEIALVAAGIVTMAFGLLALLGWVSGWLRLASFGANLIPMAPSTAVLFLLYGAAICWRTRAPLSGTAFRFSVALASLGTLIAFLLFTLGWLHIQWAGEHLGLNITGTVGGAPIGHMSPVTAFCFLLAGGSFLASLSPAAPRPWRVGLALASAGVLLATSFIFLLAYGFGTPLLYGGAFIPPALNTILAFFTLSLAMLTLAGRAGGLFRGLPGDDSWPALNFVLIFLGLGAGIVATGYAYYRSVERQFRAEAEQQLDAIAELKVGELVQWRQERLADGGILFRNTAFSALVRRVLEKPADADAQQQIRSWLAKYVTHYRYDEVRLLDTQGVTRLSAPADLPAVSPVVAERAAEARQSGQIVFQDFFRSPNDREIRLAILIPILDEADDNRSLGVLFLRINPSLYLYPFIRGWPVPSATAETLLVRREGNEVVFLNELRFQTNTALTLRISLANTNMPAVKAALGLEGVVGGRDYRGEPVLAAVHVVPDSPWGLVARQDVAEVYAPLRAQLWQVIAMVGFLLFGAGSGVGMVWRRQRVRFYQQEAQAAEMLRESAQRLEFALEGAESGAWDWCPQTGAVVYSETWAQLLEYQPGEAEPTVDFFKQHIHPEDLPAVLERLTGHIEGHLPVYASEHRMRTKSGGWKWFADHGKVTARDPAGRPTRVSGVVTDITARKEAERELAQTYDLLTNLARLVPGVVYQYRLYPHGRSAFPYASPGINDIYEVTPEEVREDATPVFGRLHPDDHNRVAESIQESARTLATFRCEFRVILPRQGLRWRWCQAQPERMSDGGTLWHGIISDITERKQTEESHARLALAVEQAAETIVITDLKGTILYANPAFEKSTGYTRAEAIGQNPRVLKSGRQSPKFYRQMWEVLLRGEVWHGHFFNKRKDGTLYEEDATISPLRDAKGEVVSYVAVKRDVTYEVQLEAQFRQIQKMEGIGQLAGGVAHDFNNILAAIIMEVELIGMSEGIPPEVREGLMGIKASAERAANLTRQLLLFSRKEVMQPHQLDLNEVVTSISKMLHRAIRENVRLQLHLHPKPLPTYADAGMLDQVLLNLAVNARNAMPKGGTLTIETSAVDIAAERAELEPETLPGRYVRLSVSDTGCGIAPEIQSRIFEPFFTTKEVGQGTGLGLATVFGIVKQHKGWLKVHSEIGKGSTFEVYLPASEPAPAAALGIAQAEPAPRRGSETILLVEDNETVRKLTRVVLERYGYHVLEAADCVAAQQAWSGHSGRIALLLTDIIMPGGMDGCELAERLQAKDPNLKVILTTGYSAEIAGRELKLKAGQHFVQKPCPPSQLLQAIRTCLDE